MRLIVAGSRTISDGWVDGRLIPEVLSHNLSVLNSAIIQSGFHTTVVNLHSHKGPCVKVDRSTPWGNPFTHLKSQTRAQFIVGTREESIARYKDWFLDQPELVERLPELTGKVLGCYCVPASCHASWLAEIAGQITTVISGKARGVDTLGERWAAANKISVERFPADWSLGRGAGFRRNL